MRLEASMGKRRRRKFTGVCLLFIKGQGHTRSSFLRITAPVLSSFVFLDRTRAARPRAGGVCRGPAGRRPGGCPFHKLELREISELPATRMPWVVFM